MGGKPRSRHRRRGDRQWPHLPADDYQAGSYSITICTYRRARLFGRVVEDHVLLGPMGNEADRSWREIPRHFPRVILDTYVIMPDHMHGLLHLGVGPASRSIVGTTHASSLPEEGMARDRPRGPTPGSLAAVVGSFKSAVSKRIHVRFPGSPRQVWQPGYYDHVIRDEDELFRLREYVSTNPLRWTLRYDDG